MVDRIVTHPGGAHKDDLLAVCVLIAKYGARVERRDPTPADLDDPKTAVVDIGGVHDPQRQNFDHHHFPREHPPTCALSLVLAHDGLYRDALLACDWLEPAEWFDSRGPKKTAEWLGVPRQAIAQLNSPIDMTLLRRFAGSASHRPGETIYEFLRMVGEDLLQFLDSVQARTAFADAHAERWSIPAAADTIHTVFLPRTDPPADEPSATVKHYIRVHDLTQSVAAIVYPDRRGDGYGIARYEDHPRLDFARVRDEEDVHFAHTSGFMCKTSANAPERLRALIVAAWQ